MSIAHQYPHLPRFAFAIPLMVIAAILSAAAPLALAQPATAPSANPRLGGVVQNEQGDPIAKAEVTLFFQKAGDVPIPSMPDARSGDPLPASRPSYTRHFEGTTSTTDAAGRWGNIRVPKDAVIIGILIVAPGGDYVSLSPRQISMKDLRAQTAAATVSKLRDLNGVVVDGSDLPVAGAQISAQTLATETLAFRPSAATRPASAITDADGQFTLPRVAAEGALVVKVSKDGFGTVYARLPLPPRQDARLVMLRPRKIIGLVTDRDGAPVAGAKLQMAARNGENEIIFDGVAGTDGRYEAPNLPRTQILVRASKDGYEANIVGVNADQDAADIILARPVIIEGTVTDAVTHLPLLNFSVAGGEQRTPNDIPTFQPPQVFHDGRFSLRIHQPWPRSSAWFVRVESPGHAPIDSDPLRTSGKVDFELQPAPNISGHVVAIGGALASGATVYLIQPGTPVQLLDGRITLGGQRNAAADAKGYFEFPPQSDQYLLIAVSVAGYAQAQFAADAIKPELKMSPWGRIEGRALTADKPDAEAAINVLGVMGGDAAPAGGVAIRVQQQSRALADADGHFVVEHLAPGDLQIIKTVVKLDPNHIAEAAVTQTQTIVMTPGTTEHLTLGGDGRPVIGRLILPAALTSRPDWRASAFLNTRVNPPPPPADFSRMTRAQQEKWNADFNQSEQGHAYRRKRLAARNYSFTLAKDGTFRVEDVVAGDYTMQISIASQEGGSAIQNVTRELTVPPIDGGRSGEPLQIPDISFTAH